MEAKSESEAVAKMREVLSQHVHAHTHITHMHTKHQQKHMHTHTHHTHARTASTRTHAHTHHMHAYNYIIWHGVFRFGILLLRLLLYSPSL